VEDGGDEGGEGVGKRGHIFIFFIFVILFQLA
jgi:hypothetical protein